MAINLKICLPDKAFDEENNAKVVLPIINGTLTVIDDRAPTMLLLKSGVVQLLDKNNKPVKRWFINGGVADIANNACTVATEEAVELSGISLNDAEEKAKESPFYREVYNYLKVFG